MRDRTTRPLRLGRTLNQTLRQQGLGEGLESLASLNRLWTEVAGPEWRRCSWVRSWDGATLEVGVTGAGAATRLRFEAPALLAGLRKRGLSEAREIRARVQPQDGGVRPERHRRYSPTAAEGVAREAAEVEDADLRAALNRLASHLETPPGED